VTHAEIHTNWVKTTTGLKVLLKDLNEKKEHVLVDYSKPCAGLYDGITAAVHTLVCQFAKDKVPYQHRWDNKKQAKNGCLQ
jgi:hypothetical protein